MNLNYRLFNATKIGTKKIDGRTSMDEIDKRYDQMVAGYTLTFANNVTNGEMVCEVLFVNKYLDTRSMLEAEGKKCLI